MSVLEILLLCLALGAAAFGWSQRRRLRVAQEHHERELAQQRAQREVELAAQAERTAALFDRMVEGILVVGPLGKIRLAPQP